MRRSLTAFFCTLALVAGTFPRVSAAAIASNPGATVLLVGIGGPSAPAEFGMWAARQCIRLMMLVDDLIDHLKDDVRRAQHPQRAPRVLPAEPPGPPTVQPVPNGPRARRMDAPAPIPDSLPARAIS